MPLLIASAATSAGNHLPLARLWCCHHHIRWWRHCRCFRRSHRLHPKARSLHQRSCLENGFFWMGTVELNRAPQSFVLCNNCCETLWFFHPWGSSRHGIFSTGYRRPLNCPNESQWVSVSTFNRVSVGYYMIINHPDFMCIIHLYNKPSKYIKVIGINGL